MEIILKAEAEKIGLKRYFTGVKCKNGHIAYRYTQSGTCSACVADATAGNRKENWVSTFSKRELRAQLIETRIRAYPGDMGLIKDTAIALVLGRFPSAVASDCVINRPPTGPAGGTALYVVLAHADDVRTLKDLEQVMLDAHVADVPAMRRAGLNYALSVAAAEAPAIPDWQFR